MGFTFSLTTDIGKTRLLIPDSQAGSYVFEDEEIQAFLEMESGVKRGAALALEVIASNEALVLKAIHLLDLSTDGPKVAASLLQRAATLRKQADDADETAALEAGGAFDIAEMVVDPFTARDRLLNQALRGEN